MELRPDHPLSQARGARRSSEQDGSHRDQLITLLFGIENPGAELPPLADLLAGLLSLADGTRQKVLLPLSVIPAELVFVRRGDEALVSHYTTGPVPEIILHDAPRSLRALLDAASACVAEPGESMVTPALTRLGERARQCVLVPDVDPAPRAIERSGGFCQGSDEDAALAFAFTAMLAPQADSLTEGSSRADVHAMLFDGSLSAHIRGRHVPLMRGTVMLAVQRMVAAVRSMVDAWQAGRTMNVRLRSGAFVVGARLLRNGEVSLTLGTVDEGTLTVPALDVPSAALPVLRVASDLIRALVGVDRGQTRNLRVTQLREEVRTLRRVIRARHRIDGFVNADPDRLRRAHAGTEPTEAPPPPDFGSRPLGRLRFTERWRAEVEGLDSSGTFLCGDRIVVSTPRQIHALARDTGELLWSRGAPRASSLMAGTMLLRLAQDGNLELWNVLDGEVHAHTRIAPRVGHAPMGVYAGGGDIPPVAILAEGQSRLVAIDLRTGEPRWRFASRGAGTFRLKRAGRILIVVAGDGAVHALDVSAGEVVWRLSERSRFSLPAAVLGDLAVVLGGEPGGASGEAFGLDLYSGELRWRQPLLGAPAAAPTAAANRVLVSTGLPREAVLSAYNVADGTPSWSIQDPGLGRGGAPLSLDHTMVINAPGGRVTAIELASGDNAWQRALSNPVTDDVPRRLEPVLRGGALFVPSSSVHVLRTSDGESLGATIECELIPDLLRVDERGWLYVAEDSGHLRAYAPAPHLTLVK